MRFGSVVSLGALYFLSFHFIYSNHFSYALDLSCFGSIISYTQTSGGLLVRVSKFYGMKHHVLKFRRSSDQIVKPQGGCVYGLNFIKIYVLSTEEQFITSNQITIN
jgi:hypothetical protein